MHATWTVSQEVLDTYRNSLKAWKKLDIQREIDRKKYFEGFNVGREKQMFKEELDDLEKVYEHSLNGAKRKIEDVLPSLLHYMEEFVCANKALEGVEEKLDVLREKMGKNQGEKKDE